jgi:hypothetical protein
MKIKPPSSTEINRIADWIELHVLVSGSTISKSKIRSLLEKESLSIDEEDVDSAFTELQRRLRLYGEIKPFEVIGNNVKSILTWKELPVLALCLYYSTYGVGVTKKGEPRDHGTKLFEDITKFCLESYFQSEGHLFGAPSAKSFKEQLNDFAKAINEKRHDDPGPHDKDRDVDLIVYKQFDEFRNNSILVFVQCAAGKNWDEKKAVAIDSYRRFVSFSLKATVSSLAITQIVDISDWPNACDDYGIVIDRARLYRIFSSKKVIPKKLDKEISEWFKTKVA